MEGSPLRPRDWSRQPPQVYAEYKSTPLRSITKPLVPLRQTLSELSGPVYGHDNLGALDADLTRNAVGAGPPIGERLIVTGRVLDEEGRPVRGTLVEVWQTNAAGRYVHVADQHDAPLDPNFHGGGRCITDGEGRYRFLTVRPGAYPWGNHHNAWRPAHIHFSMLGPSIAQRLITQMYFPGDPMLALDPIYNATPVAARDRLVADFSIDVTEPGYALGYVFDIVLRGRLETPMEAPHA